MIKMTDGESLALLVGFAFGWLASWLNRPRKIGVTPEDFGAVRPQPVLRVVAPRCGCGCSD